MLPFMKKNLIAALSALTLFSVALNSTAAETKTQPAKMKPGVTKSSFGKTPEGKEIELYTLTNDKGLICKIMTFGAIITELHVPDRDGKMGDVVLGFDKLDGYLEKHPYFGAAIGRYANRIAKGKFTVDGKTYTVATNNGPNHLHGGLKGFDKVVWKAEILESALGPSVKFSYLSPDGEEGYPGNLTVMIIYTLTDKNELRIDYVANTDKATPVNLTNHSYFNLACEDSILHHVVEIFAHKYTPVIDDNLIPTGELKSVKGTPLDFTGLAEIGSRIRFLPNKPTGYDHNYVLDAGGKGLTLAARVIEPKYGRVMEVSTTEPGLQFYTGNFLDGSLTGKYGRVYKQYSAFCMECDHFPDSPNQAKFPTTILRPGQTFSQTTCYRFLVTR